MDPKPATTTSQSRPKRILLIDGSYADLMHSRKALEKRGYEVKILPYDEASYVGKIHDAVLALEPDAILTEWKLNNQTDGVGVAALFSGHGHLPKLPVIIHTPDTKEFYEKYGLKDWRETPDLSEALGVVKKGRHGDIDTLFKEHFQKNPNAQLGETHERPNPSRGR